MSITYASDTTAPTVTAFTMPATSSTLDVSVISFTATDNVAVTGYIINESATAPSASDPNWVGTAPTSYTFSGTGTKTAYAWAKDAVGNISASSSATVSISTGGGGASSSLLHNSANLGTTYGTWGTAYSCDTCHAGSGANIKQVRAAIDTPIGSRTVAFSVITSTGTAAPSMGNDQRTAYVNASRNVCEVCHHQTAYHQYSSTKIADKTHKNNSDCVTCHVHRAGFKASCDTCHGSPPTTGTIGGPTGLASPATGALGASPPADGGAHATHTGAPHSMKCVTCHNGYNGNQMGNTAIEMGFAINGVNYSNFKSSVSTGSLVLNSSLQNGYTWSTSNSPGTTFTTAAGTTTCSVYCHGSATPAWGSSLADTAECDSCHGGNRLASASNGSLGPITTGKHTSHINNANALMAQFACGRCHANTVATSDDRVVTGAASHLDGAKDVAFDSFNPSGNSTTCASLYCHSDGKGLYRNQDRATTWTGGTSLTCKGCHGSDPNAGSFTSQAGEPNYSNAGTGQTRANSHSEHVGTAGASTCGNCHTTTTSNGTSITGTAHLDAGITVIAGNSKTFTWTSGTKTCSNISCHSGATARWGATLGCTGCHGNDAASGAPMTTGRHTGHVNNAAVIGTNFGCVDCHAKTVSSNSVISNSALHGNSFVDYSGAKAGKSTTYSSATGQCTATYCHTDGKGTQKITAANNWDSGATLTCKGCHGSDTNGGSVASVAGEPNYSNAGSGALKANSHNRHVTAATDCTRCHNTTSTNGTSITGTAHLNGTHTVVFNSTYPGVYTDSTNSCASSCHGSARPRWGAVSGNTGCDVCHSTTIAATFRNTSGVTRTTDEHTGAHAAHLNGLSNYTNTVACTECHVVPATNYASGHINSARPAEITYGTLAKFGSAPNTATGTPITCTNYCHGSQMPYGSANGTDTSPTWNTTSYLTGTPNKTGDCAKCHGCPPTGYTGSSHGGSETLSQCNGCHTHVDTNGNFTAGANRALHMNGTVEASGGDCIGCHTGIKGGRRAIGPELGASSTYKSHHITSGTMTKWHCILCHAEGDTSTGNTVSALHPMTANQPVDLRNVDSPGNPGTAGTNYWSIPETKTAAAYANIDTFCMKCHDSNGANGIAMNTTGDGLQIATGPTNKQKPFNDNMTNGYDQVARTYVVNVFDQFATTNASHHAVRGRKYSTGGTQYLKVASKFNTYTILEGSAVTDSSLMHCNDCHYLNGHGTANAEYMLQNSSGADALATVGTQVCQKCHLASYENNTAHTAGAKSDFATTTGQIGSTNRNGGNGNITGISCTACHNVGATVWGGIHGGNNTYVDGAGATQTTYRFMPGMANSKYAPAGWTTTNANITCYTPSNTSFTSCTQHTGGVTKAIPRPARPLSY